MAEVKIEDVTKVFPGNVVAVKNCNLTINDREFLVLVGPSGCGKSTTLRMVAGLEEITEGTISIDSVVVNDIPPKDRDIAMVFQNYALYPHMSVFKNMAFGLKLRKFPKAEINARVQEAARILGITELLDRKPKALSGGQRQRVAVGRAIVRKPKAFLFDEPLSNLDAKLRVEMRAELTKLHTKLETTMIYVTHDQIEAMTLGHRIVVMNEGLLQQVDEPLAVYNYPNNRFVAGFIGTPPMNFFEGRLFARDGALYFREEHVEVRVPAEFASALAGFVDREITFGMRPEDIHDPLQTRSEMITQKMKAKVNMVEPLGDEMILYLTTGTQDFIAKCGSGRRFQVNEEIEVGLDMRRAHFFDLENGRNLTVDILKQQDKG